MFFFPRHPTPTQTSIDLQPYCAVQYKSIFINIHIHPTYLPTHLTATHTGMPLAQKEFSSPPPPPPPPGTSFDSDSVTAGQGPWYPLAPGIWELLLNGTKDSHEKSVLQWYEPHATSPNTAEAITHPYIEEVVFLRGGLEDLTLGTAWEGPGVYAYRRPGMRHGPYRAGKEGCLMFVRVVPA